MFVEQELINRLTEKLSPSFLSVINESHMHSVPENSETHFKVVVVSKAFEGLRAVKRHQAVYGLLPDLLQNPIHAIALHLFTLEEWEKDSTVKDSPNCLGGSKSDN